jgi:hypothetical protein
MRYERNEMSHEQRIKDYLRYVKRQGIWRIQKRTEAQAREKDFRAYKLDNKIKKG